MSSKKEKPICRFHMDNKCPKKLPFQQPAPSLTGQLLIPKYTLGKVFDRYLDSKVVVRLLRIQDGKCKLNKFWTLEVDKLKVVLTYTPNNNHVIVNNFNRKVYSSDEITNGLNLALSSIKDKESLLLFLNQRSRVGVG